ncbi:prepilin peptidase [Vagococcus coleopterorum]|uniref:Prepilin peptidase n=1 Tax=Vagococcus coleopterorum TaxID=2714946 RepID=A0A6G8ALK6_9ENTE|nr:prepilin peptidase [Vagococcus coleopterorum]
MLNATLFYIGCCFGSFLNQVALKNVLTINFQRSTCDSCSKQLTWYDLIPLFSYILYRRKCRYCNFPIAYSYLIAELICGALFILIFCIQQLQSIIIITTLILAYLYSLMDYYHLEINPTLFYLPNILLLVTVVSINGITETLHISFTFLLFIVLFSITKLLPNSLGGADIKIILSWSIFFEPSIILITLILSSGIGLCYSLLMTKTNTSPFIPFLTLGLLLALLLNK